MIISELIQELENAKSICGDVPVVFSTDDEGNNFFSLDKNRRSDYTDCVIFWPGLVGENPEDVICNNAE